MAKQWKENPPGPEQIKLDELFEKGAINELDNAVEVQAKYPLFQNVTERVFALKFRKTKAKWELMFKNLDRRACGTSQIPELGGGSGSVQLSSSREFVGHSAIHFTNAPYITWTYMDHTKNCELVCVAICIMSGCRDINFTLSEDGNMLHIKYVWPSAMYIPQELFKEKLNGRNGISMDHPQIHAFNSRLLELELTSKSMPQGSISVDLPMKVLREIGTWTKSAVKSNDTRIILLQFQAFQKTLVIEDADTSIVF